MILTQEIMLWEKKKRNKENRTMQYKQLERARYKKHTETDHSRIDYKTKCDKYFSVVT